MPTPYTPREIEPKWQRLWEASGVFHAKQDFSLPKYYALIEFPYPSGQGLHVGHPLRHRRGPCNVINRFAYSVKFGINHVVQKM